jgi:hypothetical protein
LTSIALPSRLIYPCAISALSTPYGLRQKGAALNRHQSYLPPRLINPCAIGALSAPCGLRQKGAASRQLNLRVQIPANLVGAERFELPTLCSQSRCATRLRYAPTLLAAGHYTNAYPAAGDDTGATDAGQSAQDIVIWALASIEALLCCPPCNTTSAFLGILGILEHARTINRR